jgi:hypothetical protein
MNTATIGTISHGTLRDEDLLEAFADELSRLGGSETLIREARETLATLEDGGEAEDAPEIVNDLIDALSEFAPPYCYFGTHEGDGSDFGFWLSMESLEEDVHNASVLKMNDGDDVLAAIREHDRVPDYIMSVSDHGNVTLYSLESIETREVWAIV